MNYQYKSSPVYMRFFFPPKYLKTTILEHDEVCMLLKYVFDTCSHSLKGNVKFTAVYSKWCFAGNGL